MQEVRVPLSFLSNLVSVLAKEEGMDPGRCTVETGLAQAESDSVDGTTDFRTQILIYEAIAQRSTHAGIGFRSPSARSFADHGLLGALLMMAPDVKTALLKLSEYIDVVGGLVDYSIETRGELVCVRVSDKVPLSAKAHQMVCEENLACWKHLALPMQELEHYLVEISLDYPAPAHRQIYEQLFPKCNFRFNQPHIQATLKRSALTLKLPNSNPEVFAHLDTECARITHIVQPPLTTTERRVRQLLSTLEPASWASGPIAAALGMSERTLRRRLAREGCRLSKILGERKLAAVEDWLSRGVGEHEIANRLGYGSTRSFRRAQKSWGQ